MKFKSHTFRLNKFNNSLVKHFTIRERIIGYPPLIISGPTGVGKVITYTHILKYLEHIEKSFIKNVPLTF